MDEWMQKRAGRDMSDYRPGRDWSGGCHWAPEPDPSECTHYQQLMMVRRDLHDQIGSTLAGMAMQLDLVRRLVGMDTRTAQILLLELRSDITELIGRVRLIGAGCDTTHVVKDVDAALHNMIGRMNRVVAPRLEFSLWLAPAVHTVPEEIASAAFWIVREAVINVIKHSTARHCLVRLSVEDDELRALVQDNGRVGALPSSGGSGLANMAARAAAHGGRCTAGPVEPQGFAVEARFPLSEAGE